ncbi:MAG: NAD(+)/NADH kinase [Planctomycetia bacterium]|nr:NAD(+)/NADH kinase [Planctomycetia bacterium]
MRVIILGYKNRPGVEETVDRLRPAIASHAEIVREDLTGEMPLDEIDADVALVFGGDGSILRAVKQMGTRQLPVLAINLGRLGFLADTSQDEVEELLPILQEHIILCGPQWIERSLETNTVGIPRAARTHFTVSEHLLLDCTVTKTDGTKLSALVMNEIAIQNASFHIMEVKLYADEEFVTMYRCDGLILSTPIGSTAHNLSVGGPIVRNDLQAIVISPIAPHTLTYRPVVDSAMRTYRVEVFSRHAQTSVVVDGTILCPIAPEDVVRIKPSPIRFRMLNVPGYSYYTTLQKKLGWSGHPNYNS